MKFYQFIAMSAMAALAITGCNKNETEAPVDTDPDAGVKEITIAINGAGMTKSAVSPVPGWNEGYAISKYDIYFTSASGVIKYAYTLDADGEHSDAYSSLNSGKGIRFVGLTEVSQVYVVANSSEVALSENSNISSLTAELENFGGDKAKTDILYVGGDKDLTPIANEPADDVDITIGEGEMASQYYTAEIYLRPVISRLEIGGIHVVTADSKDVELDGVTYKIRWSGFQPKLVGIYMSNVYGKLSPMVPDVDEGFARPVNAQITNGAWNTSIEDATGSEVFNFGEAPNMNTEKVLYYSNYNNGYDNLFNPESGLRGVNYYYFNGQAAEADPKTCVPFNFFVPFDVEDNTMPEEDATAVWGEGNTLTQPAIHFQFDFSDIIGDGGYSYEVYDAEGAKVEDEDIIARLTSRINFNDLTSDHFYYANIVEFRNGDGAVAITPNTIYKMKDVEINPFNITTGTIAPGDDYNIIVRVTPIKYVLKDVIPGFDNE